MVPPLGGQSPQAFPRAAPNELTSTRRRRRPFPIASSTFRVATAVFIIDVGRPAAHPRGAMDDVGGAHELRAIGAGQQGGGNDLRATRLSTVQRGCKRLRLEPVLTWLISSCSVRVSRARATALPTKPVVPRP